jgi:hypothetical protein
MSALRTIGVWVGGLGIHWISPASGHGEEWGAYSWLQLLGFLGIIAGISTFHVGAQCHPNNEQHDNRPRAKSNTPSERSLRSLGGGYN